MTRRDCRVARAVVTGIGLVSPLGHDLDEVWQGLLAGRSGIRRIQAFDTQGYPCQIGGEIADFRAEDYIPTKEARRMSRASQMALVAAHKAVADAALPLPLAQPERVAVSIGTAIGGIERVDEGIRTARVDGFAKTNPFLLASTLPNMPAFHVTKEFGAHGPNRTVTTACATGTQAVGEGAEQIFQGVADVVIAGGVDAVLTDFVLIGFAAMRALPTNFNDRPELASRPFDAQREGFLLSEGAAILILESLEHAVGRGARIYAEVAGHANSGDAYHIAAPDPQATGAVRTMRWALESAGMATDAIDYINAHGTSTPANDAIETLAIKQLFGPHAYQIPISSTKSMLGHSMGAAGAVEAAVCALSVHHQRIHPTANYENPDPECDLDYVPGSARPARVRAALSNSFGLGGQNACLVLCEVDTQ
jgi:beta-ketoacyl-acyl-carrier-protein synthase II